MARLFDRPSIYLDNRNFLHIGGIRVCRYFPERGVLEFKDPDRMRSEARGSALVEVQVDELHARLIEVERLKVDIAR